MARDMEMQVGITEEQGREKTGERKKKGKRKRRLWKPAAASMKSSAGVWKCVEWRESMVLTRTFG
jgi:hypothetical protein